MHTLQCAVCSKDFHATPHQVKVGAKFCSQACFREYRKGKYFGARNSVTKQCAVCSSDFQVPASSADRRTTCSTSCYYQYRRGKRFVEEQRKCDRCGKEYTAKSGASRFCSVECRDNSVDSTCEHCGKPYTMKVSHTERRRFCSPECFYANRTAQALESRQCAQCGQEFTVRAILRNKYCSLKCNGLAQRGRKKDMQRAYITNQGYRIVTINGKPILEHRHVLSQKIGRALLPNESAHHINGDKLDNRPENLELWVIQQPAGQRAEDLVAWAIEFLQSYGYVVTKQEASSSFNAGALMDCRD